MYSLSAKICLIIGGICVVTTTLTSAFNLRNYHSSKVRSNHGGPQIGAVLKNFKGDTLKVLTDNAHSHVVLPKLDVEDYIWDNTIDMRLPQTGSAPLVKTETHRYAPDAFNASSFLFGAKVIFTHTDYKQTGQYSCQSIHEPSTATSLFVFVPGSRIFVKDDKEGSLNGNSTEESVSTLIIHGDALSKRIKLPCSVSNPNASVQLYKDGKLIEQSGKGKRILYTPEDGYEIFRETLNNPWGRYECVETISNQRLIIQVEPPKYVISEDSFKDLHENKISSYSENPFGHSLKHVHIKFHHDKRRSALTCCAFDGQGKRLSQYPVLKNIKKQQKQRTISGGSSSEVSSSAITPSSSFKDSNIWNNGTSGTTNSSNNNYDGGDEVLNPQDQEPDEPEPEEPILSKEENNIGIGLDDDCSNGTNNLPDDDLGFDPFHETQKAFEELIQEKVNNQRINYQSFSIHPNYSHHHHPQHHLPQQQQQPHPHHHRESVLAQHHSPLVHQSPQPPAQQQQQLNSGSSNIFPRTLLPPPGFNPGLIQSNSHPPPLQQQQYNLTNHHWTNSIGPTTSLNHHINHQQYKQAQVTLKEMEDWMSLDPAIIFSSNHLRQQPTMAQQAQTAPPGFPSMNGHIKTHPHY